MSGRARHREEPSHDRYVRRKTVNVVGVEGTERQEAYRTGRPCSFCLKGGWLFYEDSLLTVVSLSDKWHGT
jgi:hypothetical protein